MTGSIESDNSPAGRKTVRDVPASARAAGPAAPRLREPDPTSSIHESRPILIAERDQSVRKLQALFLERAGFVVRFADDGLEALEQALLAPPALIITEILIPRLDGLALCRRLREEPRTRGVPVIVFSILAAAQRASEAGASAFLRKPLVDSIFVAAVQDVIAAQRTEVLEEQWASR